MLNRGCRSDCLAAPRSARRAWRPRPAPAGKRCWDCRAGNRFVACGFGGAACVHLAPAWRGEVGESSSRVRGLCYTPETTSVVQHCIPDSKSYGLLLFDPMPRVREASGTARGRMTSGTAHRSAVSSVAQSVAPRGSRDRRRALANAGAVQNSRSRIRQLPVLVLRAVHPQVMYFLSDSDYCRRSKLAEMSTARSVSTASCPIEAV